MKLIYLLLLIPSLSWGETKVTGNELSTTTTLGVHNSTQTIESFPSGNFATAQRAGSYACVTGSTITIVSVGGKVIISGVARIYSDTANINTYSGYLLNGVPKSLGGTGLGAAGLLGNISFSDIRTLSAGTYNLCFWISSSAGTLTMESGQARLYAVELR